MQFQVKHTTSSSPWVRWFARLLWSTLWFWMGFRLAIPLFLRDNLFIASALNVFVALVFGLAFGLIGLSRPSLLSSRVGFWAFGYWIVAVVSSLMSPLVTHENILRVFGLLAVSGSIIAALVVFLNIFAPAHALLWSGRAYVLGVFLATFVLLLTNPSVLAFQEAGTRFGDPDLLHPNSLGIAYGIALVYLLFIRIYKMVSIQIVFAVFMAVALLATISKTAIAGTLLAISSAFWMLRGAPKWRLASVVFLSGLAVVLFTGNYVIDQILAYLSSEQAETLSGRVIMWEWVLSVVSVRPILGYGYQVMRELAELHPILSSWGGTASQAHNAYLDVLFTSGYIGLVVFGGFLFHSLWLLRLAFLRLKNSPLSPFFLAAFVLIVTRSFVEGALNLGFDFWVFLTCGLAIEKSLSVRRRLVY